MIAAVVWLKTSAEKDFQKRSVVWRESFSFSSRAIAAAKKSEF